MTGATDFHVIVAGGGMAGVVAAIAASRNGARTLLTDRFNFLGGNATAGLLGNFLTFHNMKGEQITAGIAQEVVDRCIALGGAFKEHRGHLPNAYGNAYSVTPIDAEVLKLVTLQLCLQAGVRLMLNTYTLGSVMEGSRIAGIRVANKSGEQTLRAKVVIDATGDADLVAKAGGPFQQGDDDGRVMSISLFSRMGGVDLDQHLRYVKEHPDQFMLGEDPCIGKTREEIAAGLQHWMDYPLVTGHYDAVKEAKAKGEMHPNRERIVFSITTIRAWSRSTPPACWVTTRPTPGSSRKWPSRGASRYSSSRASSGSTCRGFRIRSCSIRPRRLACARAAGSWVSGR